MQKFSLFAELFCIMWVYGLGSEFSAAISNDFEVNMPHPMPLMNLLSLAVPYDIVTQSQFRTFLTQDTRTLERC